MATVTSSLPIPNGRNLLIDPRLDDIVMSLNGGAATDTNQTTGGPDGGSFFRRQWITGNVTSPVSAPLSGSGVSGLPIQAGQAVTLSAYIRATVAQPLFRWDLTWYDAAGAVIASENGAGVNPPTTWHRHSQSWVAPANTAYFQPRLIWTGVYSIDGQIFDLAMAQAEYGNVMTSWTDGRTMYPIAVLNYATRRQSRSVVLEPIGSKYPTVFLREAQSKSGTLSMLFQGDLESREAENFLGLAARFAFEEPVSGEAWDFVTVGAVVRTRQTGTSYWTVDAEVREVEP